jgi:centromere protein C
MDFKTGQEINQQIVVTPKMMNPRPVNNYDFTFQKLFNEGEFMATGILVLPGKSEKPNKNSRDNAMVFVVLSGKLEVHVHSTRFEVQAGDQFMVPRGNQYRIANITDKDARLFFSQAKEVTSGDKEEE